MEIKMKFEGGMKIRGINSNGRETLFDAHKVSGGEEAAPAPLEVLLEALGACSFMDMISIIRKKRRQVDDFDIQIKAERADTHPKVFTDINITYILKSPDAELSDLERAAELSQEKYCSVSAMLKKAGVNITYKCIVNR